jgi:hypothetical protein
MEIQNDGRDQMVAKNYKNQQTLFYIDQSDISNSDNNRCIPNSMRSNFPSSKTKHKNKSKKRDAEIIARRERSRDSIGKRQIILPNRLKEYQVELYRSDRTETEPTTPERMSNSPTKMVKFYEETNLKPKKNNSHFTTSFR